MSDNIKIDAINSLEVIEISFGLGELEYVLAERSENNLDVLKKAGFTQEEINHATDNDEMDIDLSTLAINYTDATSWSKEKGFYHWREDGAI